jgi:hypothetical protein
MKELILCFTLLLGFPVLLTAQYSGGDGRGDISFEIHDIPMPDGNISKNHLTVSDSLQQNYPNPFSTQTIIKFNVSKPGDVKIVVYNITGDEVKTIFDGSLKPGMHTVLFDGSSEKSGIYFYKIISGDYSETRRMILQK